MKDVSNHSFVMETILEHWVDQGPAREKGYEDRNHRIKEILDPQGSFLPMWNRIFAVFGVFAVLLDPLFFYIPIIHADLKCLGFDTRMKTIALVSRSVTDFFYMVDIILQICTRLYAGRYKASWISTLDQVIVPTNGKESAAEALSFAKRNSLLYILIDIIALLPLPQAVIFIFFPKLIRSSESMITRIILNCCVLLQYVPRVLRIYLSGDVLTIDARSGIWIKGVFDFFPFILAGHVFGAMWYFFAVQREATCWEKACQSKNGCQPISFDCDSNEFRNITLLNDLCPINPQNATLFDFGIFLDAIQSGMLESTDFPQKLFQCFWWGLRNLSSFGSNLQPSPYALENFFAVFISISGMLLFLIYLNANLQTYVQLEAKRSEQLKLKKKMQKINPEIDLWLHKNGLSNDEKGNQSLNHLKKMIMKNVQQNLEENKHVEVENILSILPFSNRMYIMRHLRLNSLKKVSMFKDIDERALKVISQYLKRVIYAPDTYIIREGEPLDKILFITQGTVWTYITSNGRYGPSNTTSLGKGDVYGAKLLLDWAFKDEFSLPELPISPAIVKSQTKVEGFIIRANDLKYVVSKPQIWWHFKEMLIPSSELEVVCRLKATSCLQAAWRQYQSRVRGKSLADGIISLDHIVTCQNK
ncbi:hypothetical protein ABKV19_013486 [Rosa sericea]